MCEDKIEIKETRLLEWDKKLLAVLLQDKTTGKNLIWGSEVYRQYGLAYSSDSHIKPELVIGLKGNMIKPRIEKNKKEQLKRSKDKAEVFTPSWVCNAQNNLIDDAWLGYQGAFNTEIQGGWITNLNKIIFPRKESRNWKAYVKSNRLEISCGEAPYITSRYDTVTGNYIQVKERIGFLDRKLRVVSENTKSEEEWIYWATRALKSVYGYDWQGDNVLLARENILYSMIDYYNECFGKKLESQLILKFARIIAWNIWQMDGLKYVVPNSCSKDTIVKYSIFEDETITSSCLGCQKNNPNLHNGIYCKVMDWSAQKTIKFIDLIKGDN